MATLSLALGLALTTSTVSIVNAYLIRSLPYPESDRLYHVMYAPPGPWEPAGMTALDWTSVADVVEFPISASGESFYVGDGGYTQSLRGMRVTRGFVEGLGVASLPDAGWSPRISPPDPSRSRSSATHSGATVSDPIPARSDG